MNTQNRRHSLKAHTTQTDPVRPLDYKSTPPSRTRCSTILFASKSAGTTFSAFAASEYHHTYRIVHRAANRVDDFDADGATAASIRPMSKGIRSDDDAFGSIIQRSLPFFLCHAEKLDDGLRRQNNRIQ